jgi:hypothetical protein
MTMPSYLPATIRGSGSSSSPSAAATVYDASERTEMVRDGSVVSFSSPVVRLWNLTWGDRVRVTSRYGWIAWMGN